MTKALPLLLSALLVSACTLPSINSRDAFLHNPQLREAVRIGADVPSDTTQLTAGQLALIRIINTSDDNSLRRKQRINAIINR